MAQSSTSHRGVALIAALVAAAAILAWWPALRGEFLNWDDTTYVLENPMLSPLSADNIARMFTTSYAANWHPLTWLSHAFDWALFRDNAAAHHAVNVALHAANAALVFIALAALTGARGRAAAVALLFAVHPLRAESVVWISERKDLLCAFFFFLAIIAYARYCARASRRRFAAVVAAHALALLAKPMAVTLPVVLLALDFWPLGRVSPLSRGALLRAALEKAPLFALSAAASIATVVAQSADAATISLSAIALRERLANAAVATVGYLGHFAWPLRLSPFYPFPGHVGAPPLSALAVALAVAALAAITLVAVRLRATRPYILAGWLWYLAMLLPVSGIVQVGSQAMADRYTYLPLIGPVVAFVWVAADVLGASRVLRASHELRFVRVVAPRVALAAAALFFCALSWRQAGFWRDSQSLWTRAIEIAPRSAVAHGHLGHALVEAGRIDDGIAEYRAAIALSPTYEVVYLNLGLALSKLGRADEAMETFRQVLEFKPDFAPARYQLANRMLRRGQVDEAIAHYRDAIRDDPLLSEAHYDLAVILVERGAFDEAASHYEAAIRARPRYAEAQLNLGALYASRGRVAEARALARRVLAEQPPARAAEQAEALLRACDARANAASP
ncbi:MAG: tetratricopeptide repeat protein [bacterium]